MTSINLCIDSANLLTQLHWLVKRKQITDDTTIETIILKSIICISSIILPPSLVVDQIGFDGNLT